MKKIALVIILCAGFLKGMEAGHFPLGNPFLGQLPKEIKVIVITALNTYDKFKDVIKAIKAMSLTNKELNEILNEKYGNQEGFTALVHILADKFGYDLITTAYFFHTPAGDEYVNLFKSLISAIESNNVDQVIQFIEQKVDVNGCMVGTIPLIRAVAQDNSIMVKLLLSAGANPNAISPAGTALDFAQRIGASEEIIQLLKKAGAKKSSELKK